LVNQVVLVASLEVAVLLQELQVTQVVAVDHLSLQLQLT
jgi:hypothetical protein